MVSKFKIGVFILKAYCYVAFPVICIFAGGMCMYVALKGFLVTIPLGLIFFIQAVVEPILAKAILFGFLDEVEW